MQIFKWNMFIVCIVLSIAYWYWCDNALQISFSFSSQYWFLCPRWMGISSLAPLVLTFWQRLPRFYLQLLCFWSRYIWLFSSVYIFYVLSLICVSSRHLCRLSFRSWRLESKRVIWKEVQFEWFIVISNFIKSGHMFENFLFYASRIIDKISENQVMFTIREKRKKPGNQGGVMLV